MRIAEIGKAEFVYQMFRDGGIAGWIQDAHESARLARHGVVYTPLVSSLSWPAHWQPDAVAAATAFVDIVARIEVIAGDPVTSIDGTVLAGYLYSDGSVPMMIYDRSGRGDVYPWPLLDGPVLRIYELAAHGRKRRVVYAHPNWSPRFGT